MVDLIEQCNMLYQKLEADWDVTTDCWNDSVQYSFQKRYVQHLKDSIVAYLQGYYGGLIVRGKGLVDLLNFIEESGDKLSSLTGQPFRVENLEKQGNEYISLGEPLLNENCAVRDKYHDKRQESILTHESDDITFKRQHPLSMKTILDL